MPDYKNGKIYKLVSFLTDSIYIGSTTQSLAVRKAGHKRAYKHFLKGRYCNMSSFELIKNEDVEIILVENFPCSSKEELHKRERYFIENTENCVNKVIPTRTDKEWREENKENIQKFMKEWREKNKEKIKTVKKDYYEKNIDEMKEKHKIYNDNNKERIQEYKKNYNKEYREKNEEKWKKYQSISYNCSCGSIVKKCLKNRHEKSQKHLSTLK
jgi:hypothetical protein